MEIRQEPSVDIFSHTGRHCANRPPEVFFPSDAVGVDRARKICQGCPILQQCLDYAIVNHEEHGVWGGASERERRRLRKQRRIG